MKNGSISLQAYKPISLYINDCSQFHFQATKQTHVLNARFSLAVTISSTSMKPTCLNLSERVAEITLFATYVPNRKHRREYPEKVNVIKY